MIWSNKNCPLCNKPLEVSHGSVEESLYVLRCNTKVNIPFNYKNKILSTYMRDCFKSHFSVEYQNNKPYYQVVFIFPFYVSSYNNISDIHKYDLNLNRHFVVETPYINFSWNDKAKILNKLKAYTLLS